MIGHEISIWHVKPLFKNQLEVLIAGFFVSLVGVNFEGYEFIGLFILDKTEILNGIVDWEGVGEDLGKHVVRGFRSLEAG